MSIMSDDFYDEIMQDKPKKISTVLYHYIVSLDAAQLKRMQDAYEQMFLSNPRDKSIQNILSCIKNTLAMKERFR